MITKIHYLKSNHLDIHKVERKQLSIQFSLDGFSFNVFDIELQEYILFSSFSFKLKNNTSKEILVSIKQVFNQENVLLENYERVLVIHVNNLSTFVPYPLFDEDYLDTYIKFNNKIYNSDFFVYDLLTNQDMVSVYVPYVHINNFLIDQFGSFEYKHYSSILVETLLNDYSKKKEIHFFVHVNKSHFEIIVSNNKQLLLYNTFKYKTKEDFIYYILFTIDQLNLDVEEVRLVLLGSIRKDDKLYNIVYKYIRNVSILEFKSKYNTILSIDKNIQKDNFCLFNTID